MAQGLFERLKMCKGLALSAGVVLLVVGCSSETSKDKETEANFESIYSTYLKSCADCHRLGSTTEQDDLPGFDMSTVDTAYASLQEYVNLPRRNGCGSQKFVVPGQPERSFLLAVIDLETNEKFASTTGSACVPAKHTATWGGPANPPSTSALASIKTWIRAGAPR